MPRLKFVALALPLLVAGACPKPTPTNPTPTGNPTGNNTTPTGNNPVNVNPAGNATGSNPNTGNPTGNTTTPVNYPTGNNATPQPSTPAAPTYNAKATKKFEAALADYKAAKSSGGFEQKCTKIAADFEDSYKEDKTLLTGLFNAGAVLLECNKTQEAEAIFTRVLAQNKDYARAITSIGYIRYKEKKYPDAMAKFKEATEANDPEGRVEAYVDLAAMQLQQYFEKGDAVLAQDAQKNIRRALAFDSTSVQAYAAFAMLYYKLDKLKLADLVCRKALEDASKDYAPIYHILGLVSFKEKKVTSALKWFNDALARDPNYIPALMNVGGLTIRFRDYKTAQEKFSKVVGLDPKNYDATISLGVAHRGLQDYDKAEANYKAAIALDPKNPAAYFNMGNLYQDYAITKPDLTPIKKVEIAKDCYNKFMAQAGTTAAWASFVKQATTRIAQCDQLISVLQKTGGTLTGATCPTK